MAATETETTMNARQLGILGLAALGLALAAPVQAAPKFMDGAFIVVSQNDPADEARRDRREASNGAPPEGNKRRASKRDATREEPQGYGYGYERRQQQRFEEDGRSRGRR
jgi:hypothetical protein